MFRSLFKKVKKLCVHFIYSNYMYGVIKTFRWSTITQVLTEKDNVQRARLSLLKYAFAKQVASKALPIFSLLFFLRSSGVLMKSLKLTAGNYFVLILFYC